MRSIVGFFFVLLFVGVLVGLGTNIYQTGVAQGIIEAGRVPAGATVPVAGYGWGYHGFDILGLFFPLLFLFILFGLIRAAFSRGRGWGHGYGYGHGWGPGWDKGSDMGSDIGANMGPGSWREERERRLAEMHRRFHQSDGGSAPGTGGGPGSAGPTGSTPPAGGSTPS